jgi:hypothetical protein
MALEYYDRYSEFVINGQQTVVPYINLRQKSTDQSYIYRVGRSRMDKISQQYYGTPFFGWLIMQSNPQYGGLEANIPDGSIINVPFPLITSLQEYSSSLKTYFFYYGR